MNPKQTENIIPQKKKLAFSWENMRTKERN
jgi:hypothetical protein